MSKNILTVDDSSSVRKMIAMTLKGAGYEVDEAEDGNSGLGAAKAKNYDLILTDQNMPGMDGITLTKNLRGLPQYKSTPVLMLTTESGDDLKAQGKAAGITGWLVKPFDPQKLIDTVKKVIG